MQIHNKNVLGVVPLALLFSYICLGIAIGCAIRDVLKRFDERRLIEFRLVMTCVAGFGAIFILEHLEKLQF
jgi:hypothetical protein